ncbi:MAG: hypothetical protein DWQ02_05565 [Bacteroidetes bacterium]|nr:MAG: hypothetical protein DWQ02_05565 [Bacteroidota bacterium]
MEVSIRFRAFLVLCTLMISLSLFLFNDIMTIWSGAEASWLFESLSVSETSFLPLKLMRVLAETQENFPFVPRMTGAVLFLGSVVGFYYIAKPYLGNQVVLLTALIMGAGFLMPVLSKIATLDIWNFTFQFLTFFTMIRYLKKPEFVWQVLFYGLLALTILIQPVSGLIFSLGSAAVLWWKHPDGARLVKLNPWIAGVVLAAGFQLIGLLQWQNEWQIFSSTGKDFGKYLLFNIIGILPFIGFWVGGLRDLMYKLKRGEEMAMIIFVLMIFSILAQSPVLQAAFALMIAKQMLVFYDERYPFKTWVRATTIIHLIFAFVVSVALMLGGMAEFGGLGFRSGLIFSFMYWAVGLIGVFGMYGTQRSMLIGGPVASGVLTMFIFWMQLYPLIESKRNVPRRIVENIEVVDTEKQPARVIVIDSLAPQESNLSIYLKKQYPETLVYFFQSDQGLEKLNSAEKSIWLKNRGPEPDSSEQVITVDGWDDRLKPVNWSIHIPVNEEGQ